MNLSTSIRSWFEPPIRWVKTNPLLTVLWSLLGVLLTIFSAVMFCKTVEEWVGQLLGLFNKKYEILTFLGIGIGGIFTAILKVWNANRSAKALEGTVSTQAKAIEEQAKANQNTERRRREERLNNAIEHLGHDSDSVRMGGAHELFLLAQDNADLRQTVMDILCAHIRRTTGEAEYQEKHKSRPSEEVQSLLTLMFVQEHEVFKGCGINLQGSWLKGARLREARLRGADFVGAHLQGTEFQEAHLVGANFEMAWLQEADLTGAHMQRVLLVKAHMQRANLSNAFLQQSILNEARLHGSLLTATNLQETGLNGTYLQGANLAAARLQMASLGGAYLQGAILHMARLHGATLSGAQMQGVYLRAAQLHEAMFSSLQNKQHLSERVRQEIKPEPVQLQGVSSSSAHSINVSTERIRERKDKETDLSGVFFSGGLTKQDVDSLVAGMSEVGARKLRRKLEPHIDQPASHELPEDSGTITGTYTEKEAEEWIAEYEEAMAEVQKTDIGQ